jgi:hypothetical protein
MPTALLEAKVSRRSTSCSHCQSEGNGKIVAQFLFGFDQDLFPAILNQRDADQPRHSVDKRQLGTARCLNFGIVEREHA